MGDMLEARRSLCGGVCHARRAHNAEVNAGAYSFKVFVQDWKSHAGWSQLTKQPGAEGARRSVILSLLVDHGLFYHPDQHAQGKHNLLARQCIHRL